MADAAEMTSAPEARPAPEAPPARAYNWEDEAAGEAPPAEQKAAPEAKPEAKSAEPAPSPPPPAPPVHPPYLVREAEDYGLTDEQIKGYTTERLEREVERRRAYVIAKARAVHEATEARAPAKPVEAAKSADEDDDPDLSEYEADHPKLIAAVKKIAARNRALEKQVGEFGQRFASTEAERVVGKLDAAFDALGDEAAYGKGSGLDYAADSPERQRREMILRAAGVDPKSVTARDLARRLADAHKLLRPAAAPAEKPADTYAAAAAGTPGPTPAPPARTERLRDPDTGRFLSAEEEAEFEKKWQEAGLEVPTRRHVNRPPSPDEFVP